MPNDGKERAEGAADYARRVCAYSLDCVNSSIPEYIESAFLAGHAHATAQVRAVVEAAKEVVAKTVWIENMDAETALTKLSEALATLEREDKP